MATTDESIEAVPVGPGAGSEVPATLPEPVGTLSVRRKRSSLLEWFTRRRHLRDVRARIQQTGELERQRLKSARIAAELADRALDPIDPLRAGVGFAPALSLYREAAFFALLAQDEKLDAKDLAQALAVSSHQVLVFAAGGEQGLAAIRRILVEKTFADTAAEPIDRVERDARTAKAFVYALLDLKEGPTQEQARLIAQRWTRSVLLLAVLIGGTCGASFGIERAMLTPDLAAGKPWRASSVYVPCKPIERRCGDARTDIFFHTAEENGPWLEIDLQKPTEFSIIEVVNRRDCCPDRAFPLAIEVSNDQQKWEEIARKVDSFYTWKTEVKPVRARYVRAKALKRTWLHLERVSLRAK